MLSVENNVISHVERVELAEPDDEYLVERTLVGDSSAYATLVERYKASVYSLALRILRNTHEAEEAVQETFIRAYVHLKSYKPGSKFRSWLLTITRHWCGDYQRVHWRRAQRSVPLDDIKDSRKVTDLYSQPEAKTLQEEAKAEVRSWIASLPAQYTQVVIMRYLHDLSYAEISDTTALSVSTIRMRLHRARALLIKASRPAEMPLAV